MYIVTMHIRGTLYALLTRYIQCTLDVVINALNSFQIGYTAYVKEKLGDGLAAARLRCGGRLRIEPDGEAFIRSICKLTHVGPKQYAKGAYLQPSFLQLTPLPASRDPNTFALVTIRGRNTISRFLLRALP